MKLNKDTLTVLGLFSIIIMLVGIISYNMMGSLLNDYTKNMEHRLESDRESDNKEYIKQINYLKAGISQDNIRRQAILKIKKIILKENPKISKETAFIYSKEIVNTLELHTDIEPELVTALIKQESNYNSNAVSHAGAQGLGQIMPQTADWICNKWNISHYDSIAFDPIKNIRMTIWYLNWLYKNTSISKNDIELTLAYYNGGGKNAYRYKLYRKQKQGYKLTDDQLVHVSRLAEETRDYVSRIMKIRKKHKKMIEG